MRIGSEKCVNGRRLKRFKKGARFIKGTCGGGVSGTRKKKKRKKVRRRKSR